MNIYENLKNTGGHWREKQEATTRNLDPALVDLPHTLMTMSPGCQRLEIWTL